MNATLLIGLPLLGRFLIRRSVTPDFDTHPEAMHGCVGVSECGSVGVWSSVILAETPKLRVLRRWAVTSIGWRSWEELGAGAGDQSFMAAMRCDAMRYYVAWEGTGPGRSLNHTWRTPILLASLLLPCYG